MNAVTLRRASDFEDVVRELAAGHWAAVSYERYGQMDRAEWNDQLVKYLAERDIYVEVIDIPQKSVVVVVNTAAVPTFEEVTESVDAIVHQRTMGRS